MSSPNEPVPAISRHLCRGTTRASARRARQRLSANTAAPARSDVVNSTGGGPPQVMHAAEIQVPYTPCPAGGATLTLGPANYDTDGWFSGGVVTLSVTGMYAFELYIAWGGETPSDLVAADVRFGSVTGGSDEATASGMVATQQTISGIVKATAGTTVSARGFCNHIGVAAGPAPPSVLRICLLGSMT
jgi:hypothetical protein